MPQATERAYDWLTETVEILAGKEHNEKSSEESSEESSDDSSRTEDVTVVESCDELSAQDNDLFNESDA
jgi:hypothetical protein